MRSMKAEKVIKRKAQYFLFSLVLLGAVFVQMGLFIGCSGSSTFDSVSIEDLQGCWVSEHPNYQNRFLQFFDDTVTFGRGEMGSGSYMIDKIDSEPSDYGALVHLRYYDEDTGDGLFHFYFMTQNGGVIWMKNQRDVHWFRESDTEFCAPFFL